MKIKHSKPKIDASDEKSVLSVLQGGEISSGRIALELGSCLAILLGRRHAFATQSGTDALGAALRVLKLAPGAKVLLPGYVCSAPLDAVTLNGCAPVAVDIDRDTLGMSVEGASCRTGASAVIAAHLFGIPSPFHEIGHENLIEDCAQTLCCSSRGRRVGSMGRFAVCSFYATKLLTTGHGGALALDDEALRDDLEFLFAHDKQEVWSPHLHYLLSDFNAALGLSQLGKLEFMLGRRREIAGRYCAALGQPMPGGDCVFSRFICVVESGLENLIGRFNAAGIEAKRPVFKPLYRYLGLEEKDFPNSAWAHDHIVSVPLYPALEEHEIERVETFLEANKNEMRRWPPA